jgi:hypothetical protein
MQIPAFDELRFQGNGFFIIKGNKRGSAVFPGQVWRLCHFVPMIII